MSEELIKKIAELEETIKNLEKDLIHDKLTGLKTRGFFEEEVQIYFDTVINPSEGVTRRKQWFGFDQISFLFIDIDKFKEVNDTLGHQAGDEVLKSVAETILSSVREGDTAARWGGEEILVTLIGTNEKDAMNKAEDIRRQVESTRFGKFPELKVTVSIGVGTTFHGEVFEKFLERVDKALYEAKNTGRNKVVASSQLIR